MSSKCAVLVTERVMVIRLSIDIEILSVLIFEASVFISLALVQVSWLYLLP